MSNPIITSLLDTDLYKYTMQQLMVLRYPTAQARMAFRCRSGQLDIAVEELQEQIEWLGELRLSEDELNWLASLPYIEQKFVDWLSDFRLKPESVSVREQNGELAIEVTGNWAEITHFEIFLLAIVSESQCRSQSEQESETVGMARLQSKIDFLKANLAADGEGFRLVDFGTRRRFSREWQQTVVETLQLQIPEYFVGTSNLSVAMKTGLTPVGTMAHEWLQAHQALSDQLHSSQKDALTVWLKEYAGQLGVALTDTISMKAFLRDFDTTLAEAYVGIRHDSGDPIEWGEQALMHYQQLGIDASHKQFVFSDKLDFKRALQIHQHFSGRAQTSFGIGTYLTNDMGFPAPNIVLKLVEVNDKPVAKLSDNPDKVMCQDERYVQTLRKLFG
ncbi:nicotinate phosphoribosyltransferase [Endozoicomonas sp. OPT23]|uniref:nicotinate phosphoribosyltransferase n=1 Tax=Endozoicomonas sp. OPT23 TaxID=2072845 RepID=UPI00129B7DF3|nr:nicotinate phosphoribosyltransferase [Endozoicomonas sp. OPT23]MRI34832.1 nicotinate phosphoribosyltransferase [Endozoicomonas sp. OPT23]